MPYELERTIRRAPAALWSLLRQSGLVRHAPTTEAADDVARHRADELPRSGGGPLQVGERLLGAAGIYPLPDETKGQFQDAVLGPPERWWPTRGLALRARGVVPKDVNLPNEQGGGADDPRWKAFALDATRRR